MKTQIKLLSLLLAIPGLLLAQDSATEPEEEDVFVLSPFVVDTSKDSGYLASQTMSGTRLASNMRDLSSPVTVLTQEFLEDIDATDLNQALAFVPSVDGDPRPYNSLNNNPVSTRIRGFQNTQATQNFFLTRVTPDVYNSHRFDIATGVNAILFGVGNPGGVFTATTVDALFGRNFGNVQSRFDTYDSWRFTAEWNQVLIEDRLAVRIAGLTEEKNEFIEPMNDRDERFYLALNAKIVDAKAYDLNARYQFERVSETATLRAWNMPWDNITAWQDAGSPTYASADQVPPAERWPEGMRQMPNAFTVSIPTNGSAGDVPAFSFGNRPTSARSNTDTGQRYRIGSPFSSAKIPGTDKPIPLDLTYAGAPWGFALDSDSNTIFVEQTFFDKLFTEFAWYRQDTDRDWNRSNGGQDLYVDVLETLPNGAPNPDVGQIFTQGFFRVQKQHREIEVLRFTASYQLDLTETSRWLGRHNLGLLLENSRDLLGLNDFVDVNLNTEFWANNLTAFGNRVVRRNYLFTGAGNVWESGGSPGSGSYVPLSGSLGSGSVRDAALPYQTGLANFRISRGETETDSWVMSAQSYFFNDRLVTLVGLRGDDQVSTQLDSAAVAASKDKGVYPDWRTLPYDVSTTFKDETLTWGLVGHATNNLSLFYNNSEVLAPGSSRVDLYGDPIPTSTGEGWELGGRVQLLEGKLQGELSYFESAQVNIPLFNTLGGTDGGNINNFLDGLIELKDQGNPDVPDIDYDSLKVTAVNTVDTFDNDAHGIQWTVVYNPTPNWRIRFTGARSINRESNVSDRSFQYLNENIYPLESQLQGLGDTEIPGTGETVDEFYTDLDEEVAREKYSREGVIAQRLAEWRWNLVTNYSFREGFLKGFEIGGNVRYVDELHVQALLDADGGAFTGDYVMSDDRFIFGLNGQYRKRLSNGVDMRIRLFVNNVFDSDSPSIHAANANTGEVIGIRPYEGRSASLIFSFEFGAGGGYDRQKNVRQMYK